MTLRRSALLVAVAIAGVGVGVPAAGAGSGDAQAVRIAAVNYEVALLNGSPAACQMMISFSQSSLVDFASFVTHKQIKSCPVAVQTIATFTAAEFPNRAAYVRAGQSLVNRVSRGKVKLKSAWQAEIDFYGSRVASSLDLELMNGRWLISGWVELGVAP